MKISELDLCAAVFETCREFPRNKKLQFIFIKHIINIAAKSLQKDME